MENQSILDEIAEKMGAYVSDLRCINKKNTSNLRKIASIIELIEASAYSIKEWNEAVYYILDKKELFSAAEEAKQHLLTVLYKK